MEQRVLRLLTWQTDPSQLISLNIVEQETRHGEDGGDTPAYTVQHWRLAGDVAGGQGAEDHDGPGGGDDGPPDSAGDDGEVDHDEDDGALWSGGETLLHQERDRLRGSRQSHAAHSATAHTEQHAEQEPQTHDQVAQVEEDDAALGVEEDRHVHEESDETEQGGEKAETRPDEDPDHGEVFVLLEIENVLVTPGHALPGPVDIVIQSWVRHA